MAYDVMAWYHKARQGGATDLAALLAFDHYFLNRPFSHQNLVLTPSWASNSDCAWLQFPLL